jgi:tetratricopeptide (TPR) repeat protein
MLRKVILRREPRRAFWRGRKLLSGLMIIGVMVSAASCSSSPKRSSDVVVKKNEAANYTKLADGFFFAGQYGSALQFYGEALDGNLSVDHVEGAIMARSSLGRVYLTMGRLEDAAREFGDALEDARVFGKSSLLALCMANLGELRFTQGRIDEADELFTAAEPLSAGDNATVALVAHNRGMVAKARGDLDGAEALILRAAAANEKAARWAELGSNRYVLASIANARGDLAGAIALAEKALAADKAAENIPGIGADLQALAKLRRRNGEPELAFDLYRRAFGVWVGFNRIDEARLCLEALGELSRELGKDEYALRYAELLGRLDG